MTPGRLEDKRLIILLIILKTIINNNKIMRLNTLTVGKHDAQLNKC